jgi:hypothetical protein
MIKRENNMIYFEVLDEIHFDEDETLLDDLKIYFQVFEELDDDKIDDLTLI